MCGLCGVKKGKVDIMKLYKNVDICDLKSIMENGILSIEECGNDKHRNDYTEYITEKVIPSEIKKIIIPEIFKPYIDIPDGIEMLKDFAKSAKLDDSKRFNFFRGVDERGVYLDLYNVEYIFNN